MSRNMSSSFCAQGGGVDERDGADGPPHRARPRGGHTLQDVPGQDGQQDPPLASPRRHRA